MGNKKAPIILATAMATIVGTNSVASAIPATNTKSLENNDKENSKVKTEPNLKSNVNNENSKKDNNENSKKDNNENLKKEISNKGNEKALNLSAKESNEKTLN